MMKLKGLGASTGIGIGNLFLLKKSKNIVNYYKIDNVEQELLRLEKAISTAKEELSRILMRALEEIGEENAAIFKAYCVLLEDPVFLDSVKHRIAVQKENAEYAVEMASDKLAEMLQQTKDRYMAERAEDLKDVAARIVEALLGSDLHMPDFPEPVILAVETLSPSEIAMISKKSIAGIIISRGSTDSHVFILARSKGIPAISGIEKLPEETWDGCFCMIDGNQGDIFLEPSEVEAERLMEQKRKEVEKKNLLLELRGLPNRTKDGTEIEIYANAGNMYDVNASVKNDAAGIGLFRSEFLFLNSEIPPTEEEQYLYYRKVLFKMKDKEVIIRTIDIGADKQAVCFHAEQEDNPALGCRGIRFCLKHKDIFKVQLRALLRASAFGNLSILLPMICSVREVTETKQLLEEIKKELCAEGTSFHPAVKLGVMIETPAAVMICKELAEEVDFFSVGTNDLTQYTLAVDRGNMQLTELYDQHHPAVLAMLRIIAEKVKKSGMRIGICGELGADLAMTEILLSMGYREFSVAPDSVLPLRKKVGEIQLKRK